MIFKMTTNAKTILGYIADVKARSDGLLPDIHITGCSIIAKAVKDGDATMATHAPKQLADALGKAWYISGLNQWFEEMGPFKWHAKEGERPAGFRIDKAKRAKMQEEMTEMGESAYLDKLVTVKSFHEYKPSPEFKVFTVIGKLTALVEEATKKAANDKRKGKGDDFYGLTEAREFLAQLKAQQKPAKAKATKAKVAKAA